MPLNLQAKKAIVAEVSDVAKSALSVVTAEYRGLTVGEMTDLRVKAREAGVYLKVVQNNLAKRAFEDTDFICMKEKLVGPLVYAFAKEAPGAAARLFKDFSKEHETLQVTALSIDGKLLDAGQLGAVASLPTYDEALAQAVFTLRAPVDNFVRTIVEPAAMLVRVLSAYADKQKDQ